ncbi:MAG: rhomboid family intramembrane serine protease [Streptococcaceae bacterium]|jgi:membrane associated rhomboid family serine protease|nr:rhomboid family intramembrane serine protease [Streptococcaceae bacterium]
MNEFAESLELRYNRKHLATYILTIVTLLYWFVQVITFGTHVGTSLSIYRAGGLWGSALQADPTQLWRLFTAMFVHFSWPHILMNMAILFLIGRLVEQIFGSIRYAAIYLASGLFANIVTFALNTNSLSAGASTSIFGIFGACATLGFFTGDPRLRELGKAFTALIIIQVIFNFFQTNVSIIGHIGGAIGGGLLAAIIPPKAYAPHIPDYVRTLATITFVFFFLFFLFFPYFHA